MLLCIRLRADKAYETFFFCRQICPYICILPFRPIQGLVLRRRKLSVTNRNVIDKYTSIINMYISKPTSLESTENPPQLLIGPALMTSVSPFPFLAVQFRQLATPHSQLGSRMEAGSDSWPHPWPHQYPVDRQRVRSESDRNLQWNHPFKLDRWCCLRLRSSIPTNL